MKDEYLEQLDAEIQYYCEQYYLNDGTDTTDMCTNIFCMMEAIDKKTTYIATHPKRAQNHYNASTDSAFVKHVRQALSLTQQQFADRLGVSREIVNRWENGRLPLSDTKRELIQEQINKEIPF
jgi:DNA-binding transcriptional regulator YiaG